MIGGFNCLKYYVSIHAPAWGATRPYSYFARIYLVSIHAPAWGATAYQLFGILNIYCFNPRARVGRDRSSPAGR